MRKLITLFLAFSMVLCSLNIAYAEGNKDDSEVTLIGSAQELIELAAEINGSADGGEGREWKLTADIDLNNAEWSSFIGTSDVPFKGVFDGNGHTIKNFTIICEGDSINGLFGTVGGNAVIRNLGVANAVAEIRNQWFWVKSAGGLAGILSDNASVIGCYAKNVRFVLDFEKNSDNGVFICGGGLIGKAESAGNVIENCYTVGCEMDDGEVDNDGGLVGELRGGIIRNCYTDLYISRAYDGGSAQNSFYVKDAPWPWVDEIGFGHYIGTQISAEELKEKAAELGNAFLEDSIGINNGFPVLEWEIGEKYRGGAAELLSSDPQNGASDVNIFDARLKLSFNRYIKAETFIADAIAVSPTAGFAVNKSSDEYIDEAELVFDTLELGTKYRVSFGDTIKTFANDGLAADCAVEFETINELPRFKIDKTEPCDGAESVAVLGTQVKAFYTLPIDTETVTKDCITVLPAAEFDISAANNEVTLTFKQRLAQNTVYTVTFGGEIKSQNGAAAEEKTISFKTAEGLKNLVRNGNMEDAKDIAAFDDASSRTAIGLQKETDLKGKVNGVLRFQPTWNDQPVVAVDAVKGAGTYYMSAWVRSDTDQEVTLAFRKAGEIWDTKGFSVKANEWNYLTKEFIVEGGQTVEEVSIRSKGGGALTIDDWSIYNIADIPMDTPALAASDINDGDTEVSPISLKAKMEFSVPMRQGTLLEGITLEGADGEDGIKKINIDPDDLYSCEIEFERLRTAADYAVKFSGIKSLAGVDFNGGSIRFKTIAAAEGTAKVIGTVPNNLQTAVGRDGLKIEIYFDSPIEPETAKNITLSPDAGAVAEVDSKNLKTCGISVDSDKLKNGQTYTVTVPETVRTINGYSTEAYSFSFTTVTEAELVAEFNSAIGNSAEMEEAIKRIYTELGRKSDSYDMIVKRGGAVSESFYGAMANENKARSTDEVYGAINKNAFAVLLKSGLEQGETTKLMAGNGSVLTDGMKTVYTAMLTESGKMSAAQTAINNKDKSYEVLCDRIDVQILNSAFSAAGGYKSVEKLLKLAAENFKGENDITDVLKQCDESGAAARIYGRLQGIKIQSLKDVKDALKAAYSAEKKSSSGGGSGSGGSGSGGSSGGSGMVKFASGGGSGTGTQSGADKAPFNDIETVEWAKQSIIKLNQKGLINGKGGGAFDPNGEVTRAELSKMVIMAIGGYNSAATAGFSDISYGDWSYGYIASAYQKGIVAGRADNTFGGDLPVTREDMAVIIYRAAALYGLSSGEAAAEYSDGELISDYAGDAVRAVCAMGVMNGIGGGKFEPKAYTTRAQAAVAMDRFLSLLEKIR